MFQFRTTLFSPRRLFSPALSGRRGIFRLLCLALCVCAAAVAGVVSSALADVIVDDANGSPRFTMQDSDRWHEEDDSDAYFDSHRKSADWNPGWARWTPNAGDLAAGTYSIEIWFVRDNSGRSKSDEDIAYTVVSNGGATVSSSIGVNQRDGSIDEMWTPLGSSSYTYYFTGNGSEYVQMLKPSRNTNASADAVKFVMVSTNTAPVAVADAIAVAEGGTATTLTGGGVASVLSNDTDADGDPLTAVLVSNVSNGSLTLNADGTFSYTHNGGETTSDSFTYKANDGTEDSSTVTVSITVTPVNDPPVAVDDSQDIFEDSGANFLDVLANDIDPDVGDTKTIIAVDTTGTQGAVVNNGATVSYTPSADYFGSDTFSYTMEDSQGVSATATVTVTVAAVNDQPVAVADAITVAEGGTATSLDGGGLSVLSNDTDAEGDSLTAILVSTVSHGVLIFNGDGTFSYTHNGGETTSDSFTYKANDGVEDSSTVTGSITVTPVNDPPVAVADTAALIVSGTVTTLSGGAASVLTNDTDAESDSLTAVLVSTVSHGVLIFNADGTFSYTHDGGGASSDSFTYYANDGHDNSNTVTVSIVAGPINTPPVAVADAIAVIEGAVGTTLSGGAASVLTNDTDDEGDTLTAILVTDVANGSLTLNSNGTFSYTHNGGETTSDSFTYKANDGAADSNTVTVTITITPINDAPVALGDAAGVSRGGTVTSLNTGATSVLINDTDAEGDVLSAVLVSNVVNGSLTLNGDGTFSYTHNGGASNGDSFTYKAYDGGLYSTVVSVTIGIHELSGHVAVDFADTPLSLSDTVTPRVMINTSNDHQLYFKAYNDYSDLDGDGTPETTYAHSIDYYGYFDSYKCYNYNGTSQRFEPQALTVDKYCTGSNDGYWSGNFLNWATMARIDTIRKILFGGHRRVDTSAATVLERSYLPPDIHAFAKFYDGPDVADLTPYTPNTTAPTGTSSTNVTIGTGSKTFTVTAGTWIKTGDYLTLADATNSANYMKGWVTAYNSGTGALTVNVTSKVGSVTRNSWNITNHTRTGITICNTTWNAADDSQDVTSPPLMRVAQGNYSFWAAGEVVQCTWDMETGNASHGNNYNNPETSGVDAAQDLPKAADVGGFPYGDFNVRVVACDATLIGQENCKQYPSGNYKPIGLFQTYGDEDRLLFGMIAGTYGKHKSGGDMVYDIGSMRREINVNTDGTFPLVSTFAGGPANPNNTSEGMINAWSLYRIFGYDHGAWNYNKTSAGGDKCGVNYFGDEQSSKCSNWGNPFAEIYQTSLFYYAGQNSPQEYQSNDTGYVSGLRYETGVWQDPIDNDNRCAKLFIVNFNSSVISVDDDELDTSQYGVQKDLGSVLLSDGLTDLVGAGESIHGNSYFVGENGTDNNKRCTEKTVSSLGDAKGMCPEGPDLQGSYRIAGLAYYAHTNDIRPDTYPYNGNNNPNGVDGDQKVETFAVALSAGAPTIEIPVPGSDNAVSLLPACMNQNRSNHGCTLADFKILTPHSEVAGVGTGRFLAIWEDALQGNDYDLDAGGIYEYTVTAGTIQISTAVTLENLGHAIGHGYVISGTTQDGLHIHSGTNSFDYTDPTGVTGCVNCIGPQDGGGATTSVTYTIGTSSSALLKDPLWYAAKWGGFVDSNGSNTPDVQSEWDKEDADGIQTPDGVPDNYFYASNPAQLEASLNRVFLKILARTSSGTAAAVVSSNVRGEGALYQAFYEPTKSDASSNTVNWIGTLQAVWTDEYGYLREDGDGDGSLDDYDIDPVFETYFDDTAGRSKARRWASSDPDTFAAASSTTIELGEINTLWNAREQLYYRLLTDNDIATQRTYSASAAGGRYIKTWIDSDADGVVDTGEYVDFAASSITSTNYTFFDQASEGEAESLVTYLRGVETTGYRNRTVDFDGDGITEIMRLGDIVNATPTHVSLPAEAFDILYRDASYAAFRAAYVGRRHVLYAGANDGMLHAFNGGFFDQSTVSFATNGTKIDGSPATAHPLGAELWAYVPMNLQPHLQWLKATDYPHVYYMDGKPRLFDAKIFAAGLDPITGITHPEGWGTILVAGMRTGGGPMTIDTGGDGLGSGIDATRRSAFVILDVTDPEVAPNLLTELQLPDGSFTTNYPTVLAFQATYQCSTDTKNYWKQADCSDNCSGTCSAITNPNKWYLVLGSGPEVAGTFESTSSAKIYIFDLDELASPGTTVLKPVGCSWAATGTSYNMIECDTGVATSFIGTPITVDWDLDFQADSMYFGVVGDDSSISGRLMKMQLDEHDLPDGWSAPTTMINVSQPVSAAPTAAVDSRDPATKWVFFGTGRLFSSSDKSSTATQSLYGIKDDGSVLTLANLANVTDTEVVPVIGTLINPPNASVHDFNELEDEIDNNTLGLNWKGWRLDLPPISGTAGVAPATRMIVQQGLLASILFSAVYQPNTDPCTPEGMSRLYGLYFKTGTGLPLPDVFGTESYTDPTTGATYTVTSRYVDLGYGIASSPAIHSGSGGDGQEVSVFTQLSTGTVFRKPAEVKESIKTGRSGWKER